MNQSLRLRATRLTALALLTAFSLVTYQCGKKSSDPSPSGSGITGSWKITSLAYKDAKGQVTDVTAQLALVGAQCLTTVVLTFNSDGSLTGSSGCPAAGDYVDTSGKAKWSVSGSKLTITDSSGSKDEYDYEISGNTLKLTVPELDANNKPTGEATIITLTKA
jgi:hypothetical protein